MADLEERVTVLEGQVKGLSDRVGRAQLTAETCMGRQDFLAENLIEVRKTVTEIKQQVGHIDHRVEYIDQRVERIEKEHGALLKQILAKLNER